MPVRHPPPAGRAARRDRAHCAGSASTCARCSRARSRDGPGTTSSTPTWRAIRWTRPWRRRSAACATRWPSSPSSAATRRAAAVSAPWDAGAAFGRRCRRRRSWCTGAAARRRATGAAADLHPGWPRRCGAAGDRRAVHATRRRSGGRRADGDVMVVTGTASGKSLAFNLPVLDAIARDARRRRALPVPDQGAGAGPGAGLSALSPPNLRLAIYDGDTPATSAARCAAGRTCADQPGHAARRHPARPRSPGPRRSPAPLRRGRRGPRLPRRVGSHVANVLARLRRLCESYGAGPPSCWPRRPSRIPPRRAPRWRAGRWR